KLKEIVLSDFTDYSAIASSLRNIDVAYFCVGVYTGAVPDAEFKKITVDYTLKFADAVKENSPNATLCFLSGEGADRSEKSRLSFARYKGMAENYLISKSFRQLYIFRPGYIYPVEKRKEPNFGYKLYRALYPLIALFGSGFSIKSTELGEAMFKTGLHGTGKSTLENADILNLVHHNHPS
ncbi:MAG TPA: hypothetical protein VFW11_08355, partial [Cyclobacteriaceae bacterium]|nr:hypothetical protein [Cyclobacteriaceae bacterium]